jgi:hypothetical protein
LEFRRKQNLKRKAIQNLINEPDDR